MISFRTLKRSGLGELNWYSDSLRAGGSGDRIPVAVRFCTRVQTGLGTHPDSCTVGTWSLSRGKAASRGVNRPPTTKAEVKERVMARFRANFTLKQMSGRCLEINCGSLHPEHCAVHSNRNVSSRCSCYIVVKNSAALYGLLCKLLSSEVCWLVECDSV